MSEMRCICGREMGGSSHDCAHELRAENARLRIERDEACTWRAEFERLTEQRNLTEQRMAEIMRLRELLREVAVAGVVWSNPGIGYVEVQIDRGTWMELQAYRPLKAVKDESA